MTSNRPLTAVMLAYGPEPYLQQAVDAVLASVGVDLQLVIVNNGCSSPVLATLRSDLRVRILEPDHNLGFTGGVNLGFSEASGDVLVMVNSDAEVAHDALRLLWDQLQDRTIGIAGSTILLAGDPSLLNSAGNPLHVLGLCWAGGMNQKAADYQFGADVASASGACLAIRRDLWNDLGGFPLEYFAYLEDLELSWRCWQRGLRVVVVPESKVIHHYEFSRSPLKMYLLERNRLIFLLTAHSRRMLLLLSLPLLAFELAITVVAVLQGWGGQKIRGWGWILTHTRWIRDRRALLQGSRSVSDKHLTHLISDTFDPAQTPLPAAASPLEGLLRWYWRLVRRFVR